MEVKYEGLRLNKEGEKGRKEESKTPLSPLSLAQAVSLSGPAIRGKPLSGQIKYSFGKQRRPEHFYTPWRQFLGCLGSNSSNIGFTHPFFHLIPSSFTMSMELNRRRYLRDDGEKLAVVMVADDGLLRCKKLQKLEFCKPVLLKGLPSHPTATGPSAPCFTYDNEKNLRKLNMIPGVADKPQEGILAGLLPIFWFWVREEIYIFDVERLSPSTQRLFPSSLLAKTLPPGATTTSSSPVKQAVAVGSEVRFLVSGDHRAMEVERRLNDGHASASMEVSSEEGFDDDRVKIRGNCSAASSLRTMTVAVATSKAVVVRRRERALAVVMMATSWSWQRRPGSLVVVDSGVILENAMVAVTRWRRRLRVVACGGPIKVARLLGGEPQTFMLGRDLEALIQRARD
ncbi:hypothetical protein V8G54_008093 [Vigna mungo]|uniref:Uncharacterized protein n=1 Tax=Vigna mungo TaxID=3915 RepID=A0AAQ3P2H8_VIGMU